MTVHCTRRGITSGALSRRAALLLALCLTLGLAAPVSASHVEYVAYPCDDGSGTGKLRFNAATEYTDPSDCAVKISYFMNSCSNYWQHGDESVPLEHPLGGSGYNSGIDSSPDDVIYLRAPVSDDCRTGIPGSPDPIGDPGDEPDQPASAPPTGRLQSCRPFDGGAICSGHASDPDDADAKITVDLYTGGPEGIGTFVGSAVADRAQVANLQTSPPRGFEIRIDALPVGDSVVRAYARGVGEGGAPDGTDAELTDSPTTITRSQPPVGALDFCDLSTNGLATLCIGTAEDPDDPEVGLLVRFHSGAERDEPEARFESSTTTGGNYVVGPPDFRGVLTAEPGAPIYAYVTGVDAAGRPDETFLLDGSPTSAPATFACRGVTLDRDASLIVRRGIDELATRGTITSLQRTRLHSSDLCNALFALREGGFVGVTSGAKEVPDDSPGPGGDPIVPPDIDPQIDDQIVDEVPDRVIEDVCDDIKPYPSSVQVDLAEWCLEQSLEHHATDTRSLFERFIDFLQTVDRSQFRQTLEEVCADSDDRRPEDRGRRTCSF